MGIDGTVLIPEERPELAMDGSLKRRESPDGGGTGRWAAWAASGEAVGSFADCCSGFMLVYFGLYLSAADGGELVPCRLSNTNNNGGLLPGPRSPVFSSGLRFQDVGVDGVMLMLLLLTCVVEQRGDLRMRREFH